MEVRSLFIFTTLTSCSKFTFFMVQLTLLFLSVFLMIIQLTLLFFKIVKK